MRRTRLTALACGVLLLTAACGGESTTDAFCEQGAEAEDRLDALQSPETTEEAAQQFQEAADVYADLPRPEEITEELDRLAEALQTIADGFAENPDMPDVSGIDPQAVQADGQAIEDFIEENCESSDSSSS